MRLRVLLLHVGMSGTGSIPHFATSASGSYFAKARLSISRPQDKKSRGNSNSKPEK